MKLLVAVMVLSGCWGSSQKRTEPASEARGSAAGGVTDLVRVVNPGAEPRWRRRYRLQPHSVEKIEMDLQMTTAMSFKDSVLGAKQMRNEVPTMRSRVRMELPTVDTNGDASMVFVWEDSRIAPEAKVDPGMRSTLDSTLAKFVGLHGSAKISTRGTSRDLMFEPPPNADPVVQRSLDQMKESIKNLYVALPEEPVGLGARWEINSMTKVLGASVSSTLRYKLVRMDPNSVTCEVEVVQQAGSQPLTLEGGTTGPMKELSSEGHGMVVFPLDHLVPDGKLAMTTRFTFSITSGDAETLADAQFDVAVSTRLVK